MANIKPPRSDREVVQTAAELRRRYTPGQPVMLFLRLQLGVFEGLQLSGWSWAEIARAMNRAEIGYATGRQWTGDLLVRKVSEARKRGKRRGPGNVDEAATYQATRQAVLDALIEVGQGKQVSLPLLGERPPSGIDRPLVASSLKTEAEPEHSAPAQSQDIPKIIGLKRHADPEPESGPVSQAIAEDQNKVDAVLARIRAARRAEGSGE